jgi:glycosyltransferase involved in cell wall biosynthesis
MTLRVLVVGARGIPNVEGGAEKNAEKIFPLIAGKGAEVAVLCLSGATELDEFAGVKLPRMPRVKLLGTDKLAYYAYAPWYALRHRPHVVHFQGLGSAILLWLYRLAGVRTVVRYGSADYLVGKWGLIGRTGFLWAEWQLRLADRVIAVTPALQQRLAERGIKSNVVVIPNGVDPVEPPADTSNLDRFDLHGRSFALAVGRVTSQKNFALLIEAFHLARRRGARLDRLVIVGGLDDRHYVEALKPLIDADVILTGRLPRGSFQDLITNCTVFVNSSLHEGHSNAVMEAISYERPVIISDIPENRDLPLDQRHFFRSGDAEHLAIKLIEAGEDASAFATDRSIFPTWPEIADATYALYDAEYA